MESAQNDHPQFVFLSSVSYEYFLSLLMSYILLIKLSHFGLLSSAPMLSSLTSIYLFFICYVLKVTSETLDFDLLGSFKNNYVVSIHCQKNFEHVYKTLIDLSIDLTHTWEFLKTAKFDDTTPTRIKIDSDHFKYLF